MQHRLVELPALSKAMCHVSFGIGIAVSGKSSVKSLACRWLQQTLDDLIGLEPDVSLIEVYGCAISAEELMRTGKSVPRSNSEQRMLRGFGNRDGMPGIVDRLRAATHMAQCNAD